VGIFFILYGKPKKERKKRAKRLPSKEVEL